MDCVTCLACAVPLRPTDRASRCIHLRDLRRLVLLVPQDDGLHILRIAGKAAFLADFHRGEPGVLSAALPRPCRNAAPRCGLSRRLRPAEPSRAMPRCPLGTRRSPRSSAFCHEPPAAMRLLQPSISASSIFESSLAVDAVVRRRGQSLSWFEYVQALVGVEPARALAFEQPYLRDRPANNRQIVHPARSLRLS
jgi:hypothetical protein